jgi:hypothetical protein
MGGSVVVVRRGGAAALFRIIVGIRSSVRHAAVEDTAAAVDGQSKLPKS